MKRQLAVRNGFTMAELVVVIAILGILGAIAMPIITGVRQAMHENAAVQNARIVNAAREAFALTIPAAGVHWSGAANDTQRLELLIHDNLLSGASSDYLTMPGEYSLELGDDLRSRCILLRSGSRVAY